MEPQGYIAGDLDALRQVYSLKGSSGLRCCISCKNVLKLNSGCANHPYFVEISAASGFDPSSDTEIWNTCDRFSFCGTKTGLHQQKKRRASPMNRKRCCSIRLNVRNCLYRISSRTLCTYTCATVVRAGR